MIALKQSDPRWKSIKLGTCPTDTIGSSGCFITCLSIMAGNTPIEVNSLLTVQGGYVNGVSGSGARRSPQEGCCLLDTGRAVQLLGLEYAGKVTSNPVFPCIVETDNFKSSGVPQHFFVMDAPGHTFCDPLDGKAKTNAYKIISYRLFKPKAPTMSENDAVVSMLPGLHRGQFRNDGDATVYSIVAVPDAHWQQDILKQSWDGIVVVPADWPVNPAGWAAQRDFYKSALESSKGETQSALGQVNELEGQIRKNKDAVEQAIASTRAEYTKQIEDLNVALKAANDALEAKPETPLATVPVVELPVGIQPEQPTARPELSLLERIINFLIGR